MRIQNAGVETRERVNARVAHRENHSRHAAHVESQDAEPIRAHEWQLPGSRDRELEIAYLSFEVLPIDSDQGGIRPDEWHGHDDEAPASQIFRQGCECDRRLVIET